MQQYKQYIPYILIGLLFLFLVNVIYIRLAIQTPPGMEYTGHGLEVVSDKLVYYSMIQQGALGNLFMLNPQTSEPQIGLLFSPQWFIAGQIKSIFNTSTAVAYHAARVMFLVLFYALMVFVVTHLFAERWARYAALATTLFGSGLGWMLLIARPWVTSSGMSLLAQLRVAPVDQYTTELYAFSNSVQSPLFIASHIFLLGILFFFALQHKRSNHWIDVVLFFGTIALVLFHPYDAVIIAATIFVYSAMCWFRAQRFIDVFRTVYMALAILIGIGYHAYSILIDDALSGWLEQNITLSPPPMLYVWALGLFLPLWLYGLYVMFRRKEQRSTWLMLACWSVVVPLLLYLPLDQNRRFVNGWMLPISLISIYGLIYGVRIHKEILRYAFYSVVILGVFIGTVYSTAQYALYQPAENEQLAYYLPESVQTFLNSARRELSQESVVLVNEPFIGMLVASETPARLYIGHSNQTTNFYIKKQHIDRFFGGDVTPDVRNEFLSEQGVSHVVVYKPSLVDERVLSYLDSYQVIYMDEQLNLYRVR